MWSVIAVLITAALGSWLTYRWQQRSAQANRFFEAARLQHDQMTAAATEIAALIGKRVYASQRLCLMTRDNPSFDEAATLFRKFVVDWNEQYLKFELNTRVLFRHSYVVELERLQSRLASLSNKVSHRIKSPAASSAPDAALLQDISALRADYFNFLQGMSQETDQLFRQTHFGVRVQYNRWELSRFSTWNLAKTLFTGPEDESSIVRPPTDFGLPVTVAEARLGINQH